MPSSLPLACCQPRDTHSARPSTVMAWAPHLHVALYCCQLLAAVGPIATMTREPAFGDVDDGDAQLRELMAIGPVLSLL